MQRAFNRRMMTKLIKYTVEDSTYDENNQVVLGNTVKSFIYGVFQAGNKFSQFDEGIALHSEDGGARFSDFKSLYLQDKFELDLDDKIEYKGLYYNILQKSDESEFGFSSYLLEKTKGWAP